MLEFKNWNCIESGQKIVNWQPTEIGLGCPLLDRFYAVAISVQSSPIGHLFPERSGLYTSRLPRGSCKGWIKVSGTVSLKVELFLTSTWLGVWKPLLRGALTTKATKTKRNCIVETFDKQFFLAEHNISNSVRWQPKNEYELLFHGLYSRAVNDYVRLFLLVVATVFRLILLCKL